MPSNPLLMAPNMVTAPPGPVPVPISNQSPQLLPPGYMGAPGIIYTAPPPLPGAASGPYQVPLGYTSPPPTAPPPSLAGQAPVSSPQVGFFVSVCYSTNKGSNEQSVFLS
jgi:hypothetical protein